MATEPHALLNRFPRSDFLGLGFAVASADEVLGAIDGSVPDLPFHYIATPNVDHMVRLTEATGRNEEERRVWEAYRAADLILCDSRILGMLARLRNIVLPVVPGSDLTARLLSEAARPGDRITIIGSSEEALGLLADKYPDLRFQQHIPPMGMRSHPSAMDDAARFVREHPARFTIFAVGSPQQELLALKVKEKGGARGIGFCVGASIDFLVGFEARAPLLMQKLALEWLYRLGSNPARMWRRYLVEGPKIFRIVARWKPAGS